jgi:hypothetical protein
VIDVLKWLVALLRAARPWRGCCGSACIGSRASTGFSPSAPS